MKIAIVCDSITGNTKVLADVICNECKNSKMYKEYSDELLNADLIFVGSWTDKGSPSDKIKSVYKKLHNKKIFVFGTCGFGDDEKYYKLIFENTCKYINEDNDVVGYYFCPGKLSGEIKERYEKLLKQNPNDKRIIKMLDNFNNVLDRPNETDLNKLRLKVRNVINEG